MATYYMSAATCAAIVASVAVLTIATSMPSLNCLCDDVCRTSRLGPDYANATSVASICDHAGSLALSYYLTLAFGMVLAALLTAGCFWGKRLHDDPTFPVFSPQPLRRAPIPVATVVDSVQPPPPHR